MDDQNASPTRQWTHVLIAGRWSRGAKAVALKLGAKGLIAIPPDRDFAFGVKILHNLPNTLGYHFWVWESFGQDKWAVMKRRFFRSWVPRVEIVLFVTNSTPIDLDDGYAFEDRRTALIEMGLNPAALVLVLAVQTLDTESLPADIVRQRVRRPTLGIKTFDDPHFRDKILQFLDEHYLE